MGVSVARPSRVENRWADLQCDVCGHRFEGWVPHESIESDEDGTSGWRLAISEYGRNGVTCPACGSEAIGPQH